jgi:hypothetical protein
MKLKRINANVGEKPPWCNASPYVPHITTPISLNFASSGRMVALATWTQARIKQLEQP